MTNRVQRFLLQIVVFALISTAYAQSPSSNQPGGAQKVTGTKELEAAAASEKLFDLLSRYPTNYYPRPPTYYPGSNYPGSYPGTGGYYPGSYPGSYPGVGQYPSTGTNFLGGGVGVGGGYGGYGGFGGGYPYGGGIY